MIKFLFYIFISSFLICTNSYSATYITQHGITWTFDGEYTTGQFVNGDYWVVDTGNGVKITAISPGYTSTPRAMNGSMINPGSAWDQGYDSTRDYSNSVNVGIGVSPSTPLVITANNSLVSTISVTTPANSNASYVDKAEVLTCLSSAPASGSFRPGLSGTTKTIHNYSNVNLSLLKNLATPAGQTITAGTLTTYSAFLQMPYLSHISGYTARNLHPFASGMDNYYFPATLAEMALMLHLNFTTDEKKTLLINYMQFGIDLYSFLEAGNSGWPPNGGHSSGFKWPILFSGIMLNYAPMKNIGQISGDFLYSTGHGPGNIPSGYKHFAEDGQTFYVAQVDVDNTSGPQSTWPQCLPGWCPDSRSAPNYPYTSVMIGMPEWGITRSNEPHKSDSSWAAMYRNIGSLAPAWAGTSLAARIMGAKTLWNNNAHFDYVDRFMAISNGDSDPFGYAVEVQGYGERPVGLVGSMYDTYRNYTPGTKYKNVKSITQETP